MISFYGVPIGKDINDSCYCTSNHWMKTESDENILDYWQLQIPNYFVKMKKNDGLDDYCVIKKTVPGHLGAFVLRNTKRIMNNFISEINGFYKKNSYYSDTDSLFFEKKYWDVLDKAELVGEETCRGKNDYKSGGIFYGLTTDKFGAS